MSLADTIREAFDPLFHRSSAQLRLHAVAIANRIQDVEKAISDLGRPDIHDHWQRFQIKKKFEGAETVELGNCPMNEIWSIQCYASQGAVEKSAAIKLEAEGVVIGVIPKEIDEYQNVGGNQAILPGERLFMNVAGAGSVNFSLTIVRQQLPTKAAVTDLGRATEQYSPDNTHEISRDVIASRTGQWVEPAPELANTEGRSDASK